MKRMCLWGMICGLGGFSVAMAGNRTLEVDVAQSRIEAEVEATMGSFVGQLTEYDATVVVDDASREVKSAVVAFKFSSFRSGDKKRDRHMHDWQETETYPDCRFELVRLTGEAGAAQVAVGRFTFHGRTQALSFPVQLSRAGATMAIDGEAVIDTQQYGLPIIRKFLALKVNPEVTVRFHLQGKLRTIG